MNLKPFVFLGFFVAVLGLATLAAQTTAVEGTVRDSSGAVIAGVSVVLHADSYRANVTTDDRGHFVFPAVPGAFGTVDVSAEGFGTVQQAWNTGTTASVHLEIVLQPASGSEQVTVSAARTEVRLAETPGQHGSALRD